MKVTVRYFASIREALGQSMHSHQTQARTLGELRDELIALGGTHGQALARGKALRLALDHVMAGEEALLHEGAEVAFFPR